MKKVHELNGVVTANNGRMWFGFVFYTTKLTLEDGEEVFIFTRYKEGKSPRGSRQIIEAIADLEVGDTLNISCIESEEKVAILDTKEVFDNKTYYPIKVKTTIKGGMVNE